MQIVANKIRNIK